MKKLKFSFNFAAYYWQHQTNSCGRVTRRSSIAYIKLAPAPLLNLLFLVARRSISYTNMVLAFYQNHPGIVFVNGVSIFFGPSNVAKSFYD